MDRRRFNAVPAIGRLSFYEKMERGRFIWPSATEGAVTISTAQMSYLLEGIDWRHPQQTWRPAAVG